MGVFQFSLWTESGTGFFYLDTKEVVPPFSEVAGKIPSGLPDDLHPNVMPSHSRHPTPIIHILVRFVQSVEVRNSAVAIILACNIQRSSLS